MFGKNLLNINNLKVSVDQKIILEDINISIKQHEVHSIMGPNGSGKSTLAYTIMGYPKYKILSGKIIFNEEDITDFSIDKRAKAGIFLAMQYPYEIEGVTVKNLLRYAYNALYDGTEKQLDLSGFKNLLQEKLELLKIKSEFLERSINLNFSGGEKKKTEILQLAILQPKFAILDEIDSGLDVDALKIVCDSINKIRENSKDLSLLIITHYPRIFEYLRPDFVHIMQEGKIIKSGDIKIAKEIDVSGYK